MVKTESTSFRAEHEPLPRQSPEQLLAAVDALQQRIRDLEQSLERQERLATVGTIAGLIAHEFNNILTPVLSYAQMAQANPDDRDLVAKALQKAVDGADRAGQIASAILGLVRREHAPAQSDCRFTCCAREALDRALACLARPLEKDGLRLVVDIEAGAAVAARPVVLEHVFLNLIINARNAMVGSRGTLRVCSARNLPHLSSSAARSWSGGGDWPLRTSTGPLLVLTIEDSGRGIQPDRLATIFDPTTLIAKHNTNTGPSTERRGHGLGMLVCKRLVEDAGGAIAVESRVGVGTTVHVVLPAAAD